MTDETEDKATLEPIHYTFGGVHYVEVMDMRTANLRNPRNACEHCEFDENNMCGAKYERLRWQMPNCAARKSIFIKPENYDDYVALHVAHRMTK